MAYEPFLISDLIEGKITRRDRWLLPPDGFGTLENCSLVRGVLEKRNGRIKLGQIVKVDTATLNPTLQTNPVMGIHNYTAEDTQQLLVFDKERMNTFVSDKWNGIQLASVADLGGSPNLVRFTVSSTGTMAADDVATISGTTNYDGTYRVEAVAATTFDIESAYVAETFTSSAQVSQEQFTDATENKIRFNDTNQTGDWTPAAGEVVVGLTSGTVGTVASAGFIVDYGTIGNQDAFGTIVFDRGTIVEGTGPFDIGEDLANNANNAEIVGQAITENSDESFTGDNTDFFWAENWTVGGESKTYITNNADPIQVYDGSHLSELAISIGLDDARDGVNDVSAALLIFIVKQRIVIFNVMDNSTGGQARHSQRARWSGIKEPNSWPTASFTDAPTEDAIVSGGFIGDDLYIWFENSVWRFVWTGDSTQPFEWEKVSAQEGAIAQMSVTTRNNFQRAIGSTEVLGNNGNIVSAIDKKIPDVVLDWNPNSAGYSYSADVEEQRHILYTYARVGTEAHADGNKYPDRALVENYEDNNWAVFSHPIHSIGFSFLESDITWDQEESWDELDIPWNEDNTISGYPITLIGDHSGIIHQLNTGGSDNGDAIEFSASTARFNPYNKQGMKAKFWKAEFLCDVNPGVSFDVEFFLDTDNTAYQTTTITTEQIGGSDEKAWYPVFSGATAYFHSLRLTNNAVSNRPRIHAMRLWFKPAGRIK